MPNWNEILDEINETGSVYDVVRKKYILQLSELTGRNVIVYYSGWLQKQIAGTYINDADKSGFMAVINGLDRSIGLDLILHTEGGDLAATESIVDYLRSMFENNIRAIVPQLAMSAGTMIACSCNQIVMGKHSSLGPIDPQLGGIPAHGILEEFKRAYEEIAEDPNKAAIWQPILSSYNPTLVGECEKAISWSEDLVGGWLKSGMFANKQDKQSRVEKILVELGDHSLSKNHARHLSMDKCKEIGLEILALEDEGNEKLQDAVLSLHHSCIHTLSDTNACKIMQNQKGTAVINAIAKRK